ncbi:uncharacterized protein LOC113855921 [Abrus precatorius]|uniref:Uncharacterized protein LOC113855921 n=1 Tax=Abrus precatorius TaxID=3816 RepID=A0A8B8KHV2_ABRPR|nr:uncharacterized protein LOC113855921 [Abrus precatorius]
MTQQQKVLVRSPPVNGRRERRRVGEVAGNATADCAAVCCCVPCTVMDVVVLAAYKVPKGLFKKAMHSRKRRLLQAKKSKNEALLDHNRPKSSCVDVNGSTLEKPFEKEISEEKLEASQLEDEMWAQFNSTGFWRSNSQRHKQQPEGECDRMG